MLEARSTAPYSVTAFGGREYPKNEWRLVPEGHEVEARRHPLLDVRERGGEQEETSIQVGVDADVQVDATDAARELAEEHGIDLASLDGSGLDGRVLLSDVRDAIGE